MTDRFDDLAVRQEVEDVVVRLFVATDERDWSTLESCLSDPLTLDMTSLTGGSPIQLPPREVCTTWAESFAPLDHVHHQVGNFQTHIVGRMATVNCHGIAFHYRAKASVAGQCRTFVGAYEIDLTRNSGKWRINRLKFNLKFIEGNRNLEDN